MPTANECNVGSPSDRGHDLTLLPHNLPIPDFHVPIYTLAVLCMEDVGWMLPEVLPGERYHLLPYTPPGPKLLMAIETVQTTDPIFIANVGVVCRSMGNLQRIELAARDYLDWDDLFPRFDDSFADIQSVGHPSPWSVMRPNERIHRSARNYINIVGATLGVVRVLSEDEQWELLEGA